MGYFSQRKKREREKVFLNITMWILGLYTFLLFINLPNVNILTTIKNYLFHIYVFDFAMFVYALILKRWKASGILACFMVLQFIHISATANLFINSSVKEVQNNIFINHQKNKPLDVDLSTMMVHRVGHLNLQGGLQPEFITLEKNEAIFTMVNIDFSKLEARSRKQAFRQLQSFVLMQDESVILIGDFAETPWSRNFKKFIEKTGLEIKNRMLLLDEKYRFNVASIPTFYILAFKNVGIKDLDVVFQENADSRIKVELTFIN